MNVKKKKAGGAWSKILRGSFEFTMATPAVPAMAS